MKCEGFFPLSEICCILNNNNTNLFMNLSSGPCSGSLLHTQGGVQARVTSTSCPPLEESDLTPPQHAGAGRWWNTSGSPQIRNSRWLSQQRGVKPAVLARDSRQRRCFTSVWVTEELNWALALVYSPNMPPCSLSHTAYMDCLDSQRHLSQLLHQAQIHRK